MRSLNKIIFVNSASTQYAEISLDGNVHLIGTQGVGKSTLLRAILFFYNADKTKLGIPREKKNFDQYYFPYQNSYIIYQVKREDITYCVAAFRSQGRVAFRFFDAGYDKQYFINEMGMAYPTAEQTAGFARETYYTRIVNNYEEYRNILYGNNAGLGAEFRKYALLQSKQYQNIPRTIQNVFLNSNLDAAFIKETIIKSLSEEEIKIDLSTYAHNHLRNFETELNDIRIWSQKNKAGKVLVREQGEAVATTTRAYVLALEQKKSYSRQLGWFLQSTREGLPTLEEQLDKAIATRAKVLDKLSGLRDKFNNRKIDLNSTIQSVSSRLKEIKEKKETYRAQDIEAVLARANKKSALDGSKELLEEQRKLLTLKFQDIQERYKAQLRLLENESEKLNNHLAGEVLDLKAHFFHKKEELEARFDKLQEEISLQHRELLEQAQNELRDKEKALQELAIKEARLQHQQFLKDKREELSQREQDLQKQLQKWKVEVEEAERQSRYIKGQWEIEQTKTENDFQNIFKELARSRTELEKEREILARKLANSKGSFYEWLNSNHPGWESSIGKVVDQDSILFSKNLEPSLVEGAAHLYGVQLDLSALDGQVKTLEDYQLEEQELAQAITSIESREQEKAGELEKAKQLLKKKHRAKINDLMDQINTSNYHLQQYAPKLTQTQNELHDLNKRADKLKAQAIFELQEQREKQLVEIEEATQQLEKLRARLKRNLASKKKELKDLIGGEESKLREQQRVLENQKTQQQDEIAHRKDEILSQQRSELRSKGADTSRISTLDDKLKEIDIELTFIASNQELVFSYHKDLRELFEREPEFKNKRSLLRKQLQGEEVAFESEQNALNLDLNGRTQSVKELEDRKGLIVQDLEKFEGFKSWEWFGEVEKELKGFTPQDKTTQRGSYLIDQIQTQHYRGQEKLDELKGAVTQFTGNFGENNIFKFPTRFSSTTEYLEFAQDLREFLQEDKILEYQTRVNERFAHIVRQVGKETGELQSKEGEIHQVIQKINTDFRSRNFVGAIKSMELRTVGSSNKIMQILLEIKNFNDQNGMLLGETNLFSLEDQHGQNTRAVGLLKQLLTQINLSKADELKLADSFGLEFRIVENDNDSQWVEKLSNVGSEGTDVLVKAMINILLLNVFKDSASKKFKDFKLHCMMDEIGRLHPNNVKGILKFANDRNILLINGSPTSHNATEYRYTYILSKNAKNFTTAKRLIQKVPTAKPLD